jgi:choline dehydrogenase
LSVASLVKPRAVGRLVVSSADPAIAPKIELNFASDAEDLRRLVAGFRLVWEALHTAPLAERIERIPFWSEQALAQPDDALIETLKQQIGTSYHPVGSARMGPEGDEGAVVDSYCQVHGVEGLRVVDASVMPTVPRANTNIPCIMLGERVADWIRDLAS